MGFANYTSLTPVPGGIQAITATSAGAAQGLTITAASAASASPMGPNLALIIAETTAVRWRDDGTDPTATVGMPLPVNTFFEYDGNLRALKFVSQGAQAIVNVALYRAGA